MNAPDKQTALTTGAISGIGAEYARKLAADGYNLIVTGRREAKISALAAELSQSSGCGVEVNLVELSDPVQVQVVCPRLTRTDMHTRLGIPDEYSSDWGPFRWISTQEVVACSMRCLKKKKVLCLPG